MEGSQEGAVESIVIRILAEGDKTNPTTLKLELLSENDLFFNYSSVLDSHSFN